MPHPLARARADWTLLAAAARRWPSVAAVGADAADDELGLLMQPPVAVAWWITTFAPELLERDHLDLLLVGVAGGAGAVDGGRPYQLLPLLLQRPGMTIRATFIAGTQDAPLAPVVAHPRPRVSLQGTALPDDRPVATLHHGIAAWLEGRGERSPDLALLLHPSFDSRIDFWADLRHLFAGGSLVGCFERAAEKVVRDAWLLEAYGYAIEPRPRANPWAVERSRSGGHGAWASIGWRLEPRAIPARDQPIDVARLTRSREAQQLLEPEFEVWNPLRFVGQPVAVEDAPGERVVGLPDHHVLSLDTGEVCALDPDGRMPLEGRPRLPAAIVASYPGAEARSYERVLWAVDAYRTAFRPAWRAALHARNQAEVGRLEAAVAQSLQRRPSEQEIAAFTTYYRGGSEPTPPTPGSEALFAALRRHAWDTAADLLDAQPSLIGALDEDSRTPLSYALRARHYALAQRLLEMSMNVDHLDHEGFGVIHDLVKRNDLTGVELLQRYGADLDLGTGLGFTPALLALRYSSWSVLGFLLGKRVDLRKAMLPESSVAEQYASTASLPRVLRFEIDRQLGKRPVIPIAVAAGAPCPSAGNTRQH